MDVFSPWPRRTRRIGPVKPRPGGFAAGSSPLSARGMGTGRMQGRFGRRRAVWRTGSFWNANAVACLRRVGPAVQGRDGRCRHPRAPRSWCTWWNPGKPAALVRPGIPVRARTQRAFPAKGNNWPGVGARALCPAELRASTCGCQRRTARRAGRRTCWRNRRQAV